MRSLLINLSQACCLGAIAVGVGAYSRPAGLITAGVLGTAVHVVHEVLGNPAAPAQPSEPVL